MRSKTGKKIFKRADDLLRISCQFTICDMSNCAYANWWVGKDVGKDLPHGVMDIKIFLF